ncbi:MAG TPA: FTR1 family protein [bacterium]|nr:FTR1 family protein [bacterium]
MIPTALIVFREVLEAALVVSIVLAASGGLPRRGLWVSAGVGLGLVGAAVVAVFAGQIASALSGVGQEVFNASVLLLAVVMLGWHNVWMTRHGRELAQHAREMGRAVRTGTRPQYVLAIVTGLAVLREGSEVVLFLYGIAASAGSAGMGMLAGGGIGLLAGAGLGVGLYVGLLQIPMKHLFAVTGWMLLLLASGMAAQAASFLVQAGLLPPLGPALWDTSWLLSERTITGQVLHTLVGYVSRPDGVQLLVYAITLVTIGGLMLLSGRGDAGAPKVAPQSD